LGYAPDYSGDYYYGNNEDYGFDDRDTDVDITVECDPNLYNCESYGDDYYYDDYYDTPTPTPTPTSRPNRNPGNNNPSVVTKTRDCEGEPDEDNDFGSACGNCDYSC
jgi:hypothetical protein